MTRRTKSQWSKRTKFKPFPDTVLEDYLEWFLGNGTFVPQMPISDGFSFIGNGAACVIHRQGQFQSQLFFAEPMIDLPIHTHPNVNSYELHVGGDINFLVEGESSIPIDHLMDERDGISRFWSQGIHVPAGCRHHLKVGQEGGVFISVQHWLNDVEPTSVDNDWVGPVMDARHLESIVRTVRGADYIAGQLCD
jgi:hypothetical protein